MMMMMMSLRISSGQYRGQTLFLPKQVSGVRPTTGRVKGSWFNRIRVQLHQAVVLDLFAGSGQLGLEALSQGAAFCLAVEQHKAHFAYVQRNYAHLGIGPAQCQLVLGNALGVLAKGPAALGLPSQHFHVVLLDPPYSFEEWPTVWQHLLGQAWCAPHALLCVEHSPKQAPALHASLQHPLVAQQLLPHSHAAFGDTELTFLQYTLGEATPTPHG
jgi:16S rRNA (guanine966-N2)-methyltransferase